MDGGCASCTMGCGRRKKEEKLGGLDLGDRAGSLGDAGMIYGVFQDV